MTLTPFSWQLEDAERLAAHRRWMLANEMRTGKTGSAILGTHRVKATGVDVICPAMVVTEWERQRQDFGDGAAWWRVTSYDRVARGALIGTPKPSVLILDEAHMLKSPDAKRTIAIYGDAERRGMMDVPYVWALTGTPAPNHAGEYYTHARAFGLTSMTHWQFLNYFCVVTITPFGYRVTGNRRERLPELREMLSKFISRRTQASVWANTPAPFLTVQSMTPTPADARRLIELDAAMDPDRPGDLSKERRLLGLMKVPYVAAHVMDLLDNHAVPKVLIGAWHADVIDGLRTLLARYNPIVIAGDVPNAMRWTLRDRFQDAPSCRLALVQKKAGGTGISLSAACHVVDGEPDWGRDVDAQFYQRPQHIARTVPLPVDRMVFANSLDESILRSNTRKDRMHTEIVSSDASASGVADVPSLDTLLGVQDGQPIFIDDL